MSDCDIFHERNTNPRNIDPSANGGNEVVEVKEQFPDRRAQSGAGSPSDARGPARSASPSPSHNVKRLKGPPIPPVWIAAAGIATVVLLVLTGLRMLMPPQPASTSATATVGANKPGKASKPARQHPSQTEQQTTAVQPSDQETAKSQLDRTPVAPPSVEEKKPDVPPKQMPEAETPAKELKASEDKPAEKPPATPSVETQPAAKQVEEPPAPEDREAAGRNIVEQLRGKAEQNATQSGQDNKDASPENADAMKEDAENQPDSQHWTEAARRFATEHQGRVLDATAFSGGTLRVPTAFDANVADMPFWFLSGGRLETDAGVFPFGPDFQHMPPVMRQEIPQLAERLGLASVGIELHPRGSDLEVIATATATPRGIKGAPEKQSELAKLKNFQDRLSYQLGEWRRLAGQNDSPETETKKDAVRDAILGIIQSRTSGQQQATTKKSSEAPTAGAADAKPRAKDAKAVEAAAREELAALAQRIRELQNESNQSSDQQRAEDERAVEQFKQSCRKISVVIYQGGEDQAEPVKAKPAKPRTEPPAQKPKPATPSPLPAPPSPASPSDLKPTQGATQWDVAHRETVSEDAFTPTYTEMARVNVQAVSASGTPLPRWFLDEFYVNCTIYEFPKEGKSRSQELLNATRTRTYSVTEGTAQIAIRFWCSRKSAPAGKQLMPAAETSWHIVEAVQTGAEYRVRAPLTQEMLSPLQAKSGKPQ